MYFVDLYLLVISYYCVVHNAQVLYGDLMQNNVRLHIYYPGNIAFLMRPSSPGIQTGYFYIMYTGVVGAVTLFGSCI
jgi:hypothetical protein